MPSNRATDRPLAAPKLHHATFLTLRLDEMVEWYGLALGMYPAFLGEGAAWLTNDEANHRIAFLSPPEVDHPADKGHTTGIHHTAFEFETFDQWLNNYIRLRNHRVLPFLYLDHGITMSVYYQDPDGNGVEIQVDAFGSWRDSSQWISAAREFAENPIGTWFDPEKLVEAREQGLSFEEIHKRARAGDYLPENIPEDIFLPEVYRPAPNRDPAVAGKRRK